MPHYSDYRCSECGQPTLRELLTAKKVNFTPLGAGAKILRSRTRKWLCDECLPKDPDWSAPAFSNAPGLKSPALENVRRAQENKDAVQG